ncbi:MAG: hypothetical protein WCT33_02770 [Patescibacteria group bacterium]
MKARTYDLLFWIGDGTIFALGIIALFCGSGETQESRTLVALLSFMIIVATFGTAFCLWQWQSSQWQSSQQTTGQPYHKRRVCASSN